MCEYNIKVFTLQIEKAGNEFEVTGELYLEAPLPGMGRRLTGIEGQEMFKKEYFKSRLYILKQLCHGCYSNSCN